MPIDGIRLARVGGETTCVIRAVGDAWDKDRPRSASEGTAHAGSVTWLATSSTNAAPQHMRRLAAKRKRRRTNCRRNSPCRRRFLHRLRQIRIAPLRGFFLLSAQFLLGFRLLLTVALVSLKAVVRPECHLPTPHPSTGGFGAPVPRPLDVYCVYCSVTTIVRFGRAN